MQGVFIAVAAAGTCYFAFARRRFDFFTLAHVSALVYFLPGFLGYVRLPGSVFANLGERVPLEDEAYWVYVLVLGCLAVAAMLTDQVPERPLQGPRVPVPGFVLGVLVALALVGFAATVLSAGTLLLSDHKQLIVRNVGQWRVLWVNCAALGALVAFTLRRRRLLLLCLLLLVVDLYIGFRNNLALTTISLFVIWLSSEGRQRLALRNLKAGLAAFALAVGFFFFKFLYIPIKQANWLELKYRLTHWSYISEGLSFSEPFVTQAILNEVLIRRFRVGMEHFGEIFFNLLPFAAAFGFRDRAINTVFRDELFPGTSGGVGSNIWAEMWTRGGWPLVMIFALVFTLSLYLASQALRCRDPLLLPLVALNGSYWAFYIHRNTLTYQVNLHRNLIVLWLVAVGVGLVMVALRRSYRSEGTEGGA